LGGIRRVEHDVFGGRGTLGEIAVMRALGFALEAFDVF